MLPKRFHRGGADGYHAVVPVAPAGEAGDGLEIVYQVIDSVVGMPVRIGETDQVGQAVVAKKARRARWSPSGGTGGTGLDGDRRGALRRIAGQGVVQYVAAGGGTGNPISPGKPHEVGADTPLGRPAAPWAPRPKCLENVATPSVTCRSAPADRRRVTATLRQGQFGKGLARRVAKVAQQRSDGVGVRGHGRLPPPAPHAPAPHSGPAPWTAAHR